MFTICDFSYARLKSSNKFGFNSLNWKIRHCSTWHATRFQGQTRRSAPTDDNTYSFYSLIFRRGRWRGDVLSCGCISWQKDAVRCCRALPSGIYNYAPSPGDAGVTTALWLRWQDSWLCTARALATGVPGIPFPCRILFQYFLHLPCMIYKENGVQQQ